MTLSTEKIKEFECYLIEDEKSKATVEKYVRDVTFFKEWLNGREIAKEAVVEYKSMLAESHKPTSVNASLASLNSLFDFMNRADLKVKSLKIQKKMFADPEKELTEQDYNRLLEAAKKRGNERIYHIMMTICAAGIRVSELKYITVEAVKGAMAVIECKGKIRRIVLHKSLCKALKMYIKKYSIKAGSVFVTKGGKPVDRSNIWKEMKKLCTAAGVAKEKVFPHNLRHLFARIFYTTEKDIVRLADVLGHSSVNTTRIYTMESGDIHRKLIQKMNLIKFWSTT